MNCMTSIRREFLFLQGPPGPFFRLLGRDLKKIGHGVHRINLSGGDRYDWPGDAANYRGTRSAWPMYFDRFRASQSHYRDLFFTATAVGAPGRLAHGAVA